MRMESGTWKVRVWAVFVPLGCKILSHSHGPVELILGGKLGRGGSAFYQFSTNVCRNAMY